MLSVTLIVFREVFEVGLVISILLAATKGLARRARWVGIGILSGIAGAVVMALFADAISQAAQGMGQEMLNAVILLMAAGLMGWTTVWMTRNGRRMSQEFKRIGREVVEGRKPVYTLAIIVALSVLREGAEIVMFTYSVFVTGGKVYQLAGGCLLGAIAGVLAGVLLYYGLMKVLARQVLKVTGWMLVFLVAGMVAQAFGYLTAAGKVPEIIPWVWDTTDLVSDSSFLGKILHVLAGYTARPSGIQLLAYLLTVGGLAAVLTRDQE